MLFQKEKREKPTIKVKQKLNEYQLLLPKTQIIIPLGHCDTKEKAKDKAINELKKINASGVLMQKRLVTTNMGESLEMFWEEMVIKLKCTY